MNNIRVDICWLLAIMEYMPRPYPDLDRIKQVMKYRRMKPPVTFREIGKRIGVKDVKSVYKYYLQGLGKIKVRIG